MEWVLLGMGVTVITASLDEIHQSFMASRTGRWQDVVLDACGAAVLQIFIYFFSLRALEPPARARRSTRIFVHPLGQNRLQRITSLLWI